MHNIKHNNAVNPSELVEQLNALAKKEGISFSEAVRRAMSNEDLQTTLATLQRAKSRAA